MKMKKVLALVMSLAMVLSLAACGEKAPASSAGSARPGSTARRATPGSISFVPGAAGLIMAGAILRDLGQF